MVLSRFSLVAFFCLIACGGSDKADAPPAGSGGGSAGSGGLGGAAGASTSSMGSGTGGGTSGGGGSSGTAGSAGESIDAGIDAAGGSAIGRDAASTDVPSGEAGSSDAHTADAPPFESGACGAQTADVQAIPNDIFVMLDKSSSMLCPAADSTCETPPQSLVHPTRWDAFAQAVNTFVSAPASAGVGVGLGYFSLDTASACNVPAYATPTVPIAVLPANATNISNAVAAILPQGNTPTVPALEGALQYATIYGMSTPGRDASVVLVTDSYPNGCGSTIAAAAMAAQQAFAGTPRIRTYVVGLGNTPLLDSIALAGSGNATHYFQVQGDVAAQLLAALTTISGAFTCAYSLPSVASTDPTRVNVEISLGAAMPQRIGNVGSSAMCGSTGGWYYDNPIQPTRLTLCPQSCEPLKTNPNSQVQVLFGCPTIGPT
jgi:hypothetical protein